MSWKDNLKNLIVEKGNNENSNTVVEEGIKKPAQKSSSKKISFPSDDEVFGDTNTDNNSQTPPKDVISNNSFDNKFLSKVSEAYQNAFDSLNKDGYDFYEFFNAVKHGGIDNSQVYSMALVMGSGMDKTITKEKLISQADEYISALTDIYKENLSKGSKKREDIISQKETETENLNSELESLKKQLSSIQTQIKDKEKNLSFVDSKYKPLISDTEAKLSANETVKNNMVSEIEKVKSGIAKI